MTDTPTYMYELGEKLRALQNRITELEAQFASSDVATKSIYQFLSGAKAQGINLVDANVSGTTTDSSSATHSGTHTYEEDITLEKKMYAKDNIILQNGANDATISKTAGSNEIVADGNFNCVGGIFAATTVKVGTKTISESSGLLVSTGGFAATGGDIVISGAGNNFIQEGAADGGSGEGYEYLDAGGDQRLSLWYPGSDVVALGNQVENGVVKLQANDANAGVAGVVDVATVEDTAFTAKVALVSDVSIQVAGGAVITTLGDTAALAASDVKVPTNTTVKEYVDAYCMIGAGNAQWVTCQWRHEAVAGSVIASGAVLRPQTTATQAAWEFPLPVTLGSLTLYCNGVRIGVTDADANNEISDMSLFRYDIYVDTANSDRFWQGTVDDAANFPLDAAEAYSDTFTAVDVGTAYESLYVMCNYNVNTNNNLDHNPPQVQVYYA